MRSTSSKTFFFMAVISILLLPWLAQARTHNLGFGLRAGMGLDPDQFVVGAQFSMGKSIGIFRFVPSVDVGFGSNLTVFNLNADFLLRLLIRDTPLELYGGVGPTLVFWDFKGSSAWEFAGTLILGTQVHLSRSFASNLEARIGIGDTPDFRLLLVFFF
jgi:hypothetical protein